MGYSTIPATKNGNGTTHWAWGLAIPQKSQAKKYAWEFIKWATSKEIDKLAATKTLSPTRQSTWNELSKNLNPEFVEVVQKSIEMSIPGYMYFPGSREIADRIIDAVIMISKGKEPNEVMQWLENQSIEILKKNKVIK